nr:glutamyl-trna(gln) amidotransferase subunit a, mitochondrial [Quercus suber]
MLSKYSRLLSARRNFNPALRRYNAPVGIPNDLNAIIGSADAPQDADTKEKGPLTGKSIAVKDNIVTTSHPTSAGSAILAGYQSPFDATVVELLRKNGAHISAKTNLDEFGMGSHSQNSAPGAVKSLFSRGGVSLSPGGSSGGSAVAVATGQCWAALGTDTGGSVRLPAAYTGAVGFKPSYGRLSRWGVIQYANSLDTVGVLSRTVQDARRVFGVLDQYDEKDPTSLSVYLRTRIHARAAESWKALRIGIPLEYNVASLSPIVRSAYTRTLSALQTAGHTLHPVSLSTTERALSAYYILAPAEASSNLAKYDGIRYGYRAPGSDASPADDMPLYAQTRGEGFGEEVKRRILLGAYTLSSAAMNNYFVQAQKVRRLVQQDFDRVFSWQNPLLDPSPSSETQGVDVLLTPTAPTLPQTVDEVAQQSALESYMNDVFTVPASLAGLPALSVPVSLTLDERQEMEEHDVNSVGMQMLGQFGDDELVLQAGEMVERLSYAG